MFKYMIPTTLRPLKHPSSGIISQSRRVSLIFTMGCNSTRCSFLIALLTWHLLPSGAMLPTPPPTHSEPIRSWPRADGSQDGWSPSVLIFKTPPVCKRFKFFVANFFLAWVEALQGISNSVLFCNNPCSSSSSSSSSLVSLLLSSSSSSSLWSSSSSSSSSSLLSSSLLFGRSGAGNLFQDEN